MADGVVNERTGGRTEGRTEGRRDGRTDGRCEVVVLSLLSSCRLLVFSSCRLVVLSSCRLVVLSSSPLVVLSSSPLVVSAVLLSCLLSFGVRPRGKLEVARRSFVFGLLQSSFVVSRQSLVTSRKAQVASRSTVVLCSSSFIFRCCCLALTSIRVFSLFASFLPFSALLWPVARVFTTRLCGGRLHGQLRVCHFSWREHCGGLSHQLDGFKDRHRVWLLHAPCPADLLRVASPSLSRQRQMTTTPNLALSALSFMFRQETNIRWHLQTLSDQTSTRARPRS